MNTHHTKLALQLKECAAAFIGTESNRQSLITVTNAELSDAQDNVVFYVTVFPATAEGPALGFLMRKRGECREYLKTHARLGHLPHVEFALDEGDKHRQHIDELLQQKGFADKPKNE